MVRLGHFWSLTDGWTLITARTLFRFATANPYSPASFSTRARLLARLARPPPAGTGEWVLVERGLELLALVLAGEDRKWAAKCARWVEEADARRAEAEASAREAAVVVKAEQDGWSSFLNEHELE